MVRLKWFQDSETYAVGNETIDALAQSKVKFITHCPVNREYFDRCHDLDIRCFPYVSFYQGCLGSPDPEHRDQGFVNIKNHPNFIELEENGVCRRSIFWNYNLPNTYALCPNVKEYVDYAVDFVTKIMREGADGIFVDNLISCPPSRKPCYGPEATKEQEKYCKQENHCKHEHYYKHDQYPTGNAGVLLRIEDQNNAFAYLLSRIRKAVIQVKPDGAILGNSAYPPTLLPIFWKYLDADMSESYICSWESKYRWNSINPNIPLTKDDWENYWNSIGSPKQPYMREGKKILALSYLGYTSNDIREDAFFCYASARLSGFAWNGGLPISSPESAVLYRISLGEAQTPNREKNGVHYRVFKRGLVAVNPDTDKNSELELPTDFPKILLDLFGVAGADNWNGYKEEGCYRIDRLIRHSEGKQSINCINNNPGDISGAVQMILLNQSDATPLELSGWSKAENVSGSSDRDYSLYIDAKYADGSWFLLKDVSFTCGTHDWELQSATIVPDMPLEKLAIYAMFRNHIGSIWFDDISLHEVGSSIELIKNGGFELESNLQHIIDLNTTKFIIPRSSGRVYLFQPAINDELISPGPKLKIRTSPTLGAVCFRVDGFCYWTDQGFAMAGGYATELPFGTFETIFDRQGEHTIEIVYTTANDLIISDAHMDPHDPTKPSEKKYKFNRLVELSDPQKVLCIAPETKTEGVLISDYLELEAQFDETW